MRESLFPAAHRKPYVTKKGRLAQFSGPVPLCTDAETYEQWKALSRGAMVAGFCTDCTGGYKRKMMQEGRCENPTVKFKFEDDFITGYIPSLLELKNDQEKREKREAELEAERNKND